MKKLRVEPGISRGRHCDFDLFLEQKIDEKPARGQIERNIDAERLLGSILLCAESGGEGFGEDPHSLPSPHRG